jgi:hypothetical protein
VLPVQLARHDDGVDIAAAHASLKRWWRHFRSATPADLWIDGGWKPVELRVLAGDEARAASSRYLARFPSARRSFAPTDAGAADTRMLRADVALPIRKASRRPQPGNDMVMTAQQPSGTAEGPLPLGTNAPTHDREAMTTTAPRTAGNPSTATVPNSAPEQDPAVRRFAFWSAVGTVATTAAYFVPLVMGFLTLPSPRVPFIDPWFSMMEVLIILTAPFMVALTIAIHSWAPAARKPFTLAAVVFMGATAAITCSVHFSILTLSHRADFAHLPWLTTLLTFQWPSVTYTLDILAWDVFFPLAVLCLVPAFGGSRTGGGSRLRPAIRILLLTSGVLAIGGLAGLFFDDMNIRNIGIVGYAVVYPAAAVLLAVLFHTQRHSPTD